MQAYIIISAIFLVGLTCATLILLFRKNPESFKLSALLEERTKQNEQLFNEKRQLEKEKNEITALKIQLETELKNEKEKNLSTEDLKKEFIKGQKETLLEANKTMLEEHKKQSDSARKEAEEGFKKNTEKLTEQFGEIFKNINILNQKVETVDIIRRSLLTPSGAGSIAELTLENIFKVSNLKPEIDYILQYVTKDDRQRPDAIIFLPNDDVMIIDSKSSSIFLELEENKENESELLKKLKASIGKHLKSLAERDYQENVRKSLEKTHARKVNNIFTAMFLPSDSAWEKAKKADPMFIENAFQQFIFPCGPTALVSIIASSRFSIMREKHNRNYDNIIEEIRKMISVMADLFESARKVGAGLESASKNYNEFIDRFNGKFIDKAREIGGMGLGLPAKFPANNLEQAGVKIKVIEGKAIEVASFSEEFTESQPALFKK